MSSSGSGSPDGGAEHTFPDLLQLREDAVSSGERVTLAVAARRVLGG